jgi:hypothetical protein
MWPYSVRQLRFPPKCAEDRVKFRGTVQRFSLGDFEVRSARAEDPSINLELSRTVQKIQIDGKIIIGDDIWIAVVLGLDSGRGTLHFYFDMKIADALHVTVTASLDSPVPTTIEGFYEDGIPRMVGFSDQGALSHDEFNVVAKMEQNIVGYLSKLANEHLEKEGDPNRKTQLRAALDSAKSAWKEAKRNLDQEEVRLRIIAEAKIRDIDAESDALHQAVEKAQYEYNTFVAAKEQVERDLDSRLDTAARGSLVADMRKDNETREAQTAALVAMEKCRTELKMRTFFKEMAENAKSVRDSEEGKYSFKKKGPGKD